MNQGIPHVKVPKRHAQHLKKWLQRNKLLDSRYKIQREGDYVLFPIISTKFSISSDFSSKCTVEWRTGIEITSRRSHEEILRDQLPSSLHDKIPRSFDQLGNVIIVKIDEDLWPYRQVIGEAFLEWHPKIQAVYAKKATISGEFRVLPLELIAGTDVDAVIVKEHGIRLLVRFKEVFYNPRLANQHRFIAEAIPPYSLVLDAFSGIGPFSLHLATQKPCHVVTVDVNPSAIECLRESIVLNRRRLKGQIHPVVGDVTKVLLKNTRFDHVIMNFPEKGYDFLPSMFRFVKEGDGFLHLHVFERVSANQHSRCALKLAKRKIFSILFSHGFVDCQVVDARIVRDVAPGKHYLYVKIMNSTSRTEGRIEDDVNTAR